MSIPDATPVRSLVEGAPAHEGEFVRFPGSPFELFMPYPPAGDQPTAIAQLVEGVNDGEVFQTLLGVTGSGKTFTMANVIARLGRPAIVFAPNKTLAAQLYSEFREFFPKNAVEYFVSYYDYYQPEAYVPQRDLFIEKDSAINEHIEQMRLSCTKSILERRDVVIVATVSAIYGIGEPESYHRMIMTLRTGDKLGQRDVIAQLIRMQYQRNDMEFSRGKFRVRGDTIDVFPAEHSELAIRIELFDDEIESLQLFDPLTGRIRQKIPRFTVYPSSHYVTPRDMVLAAVETIKVELAQRLKELVGMGKLVEAQRLEQRTRFDLEMLSEVGHCKGIENYTRHLSGAKPGEPPSTLTGNFSKMPSRSSPLNRPLWGDNEVFSRRAGRMMSLASHSNRCATTRLTSSRRNSWACCSIQAEYSRSSSHRNLMNSPRACSRQAFRLPTSPSVRGLRT